MSEIFVVTATVFALSVQLNCAPIGLWESMMQTINMHEVETQISELLEKV